MKIFKTIILSLFITSCLLVGSVAAAYTITVKSGDTLWGLFGSGWRKVAQENNITDPTKLQIGDELSVDGESITNNSPMLGGLVTKPYTFSPNTVIRSSDVNSNFDTLYTLVNGNITNANVNASAAIGASKISGTAIVSSPSASQTITGTTTIIGLTTVQGGFIVSTTAGTIRVPSMTNTQRDALTAVAGDIIYSTTDGQFYVREGTSWTGFTPAAETALANTTTKGIVEEATSAEFIAGTATGSTGARLFVNPTSILDYKTSHWITATNGDASIAYGDIVYVSSTDGRIYKVLANDSSLINKVYGVAYEGGAAGATVKVLLDGSIVYTTLAPAGSVVYVSDAGKPTTTAGTYKKIVGRTTSATSWIFSPSAYQETDTPTANAVPISDASSTLRGWSGAFGGDGSDGVLNITSNTTTINLSNASIIVKEYTSINISSGAGLAFSNPSSTGSYIVLKSRGDCTIAGTIDASGMGAATSTRGYGYLENAQAYNMAVTNTNRYGASDILLWQGSWATITGSGGQGTNATSSSLGGGSLKIECAGALNFTGTINVGGKNGSNGVNASESVHSSGGEAGGGGGSFLGLYNRLTANSGIIAYAGGKGGTGGAGFCASATAVQDGGAVGLIGGGSYLGAGGTGGAAGGLSGNNCDSCSAAAGGAGGATNAAAGSAAGVSTYSSCGAGVYDLHDSSGGGGAGHGGFGNWFRNYWFF